jgi:hypothetical protein
VPLRSKRDNAGRPFLFAALPMFDSVLFIFPMGRTDQHGNDHELVVKPYTRGGRGRADDVPDADDPEGVWKE